MTKRKNHQKNSSDGKKEEPRKIIPLFRNSDMPTGE